MKFKKTILWSILNGKRHEKVSEEDLSHATRLVTVTLFPKLSGDPEELDTVVQKYAVPALKKKFPRLVDCEPHKVGKDDLLVRPFLASNGQDWKMDWWRIEFYAKLTTAA